MDFSQNFLEGIDLLISLLKKSTKFNFMRLISKKIFLPEEIYNH